MSSNYAKITEDNVRRRGEEFDDIGVFLAEQFYSNQTHFIYELLQNAQDALKRRSLAEPRHSFPKSVSFSLYPNKLELRHFGQPFDEHDVKGISDILKGTKKTDKEQIGRFGIGFKSVYAFTESPEIHSGNEHFVIEHYIRPSAVNPVNLKSGETLFIFPFNHREKKANETYKRIHSRLADLGLKTLLFLDEIDQIIWDLSGERAGAYLREKRTVVSDICKITLLGEEAQKTTEQNWLIFQRPVNNSNSIVEIAFYLGKDEKTSCDCIQRLNQSKLFAYFETDKETHLQFLIQGHYHTTPSRDNVLEDDEFNKTLIIETAKLLVESLEKLKSMELLNTGTLEVMPLNKEYFPEGSFFWPLYHEFLNAMKTMALLPAMDDHFVKAEEAKLARGAELIQLLPAESLKSLFGFSKNYRWLRDDITRDKTLQLRTFLMEDLQIEEIDPEKFTRQITKEFMQSQSDEWLIKFYEFLDGQKALWRPKYYAWEREGVLRRAPIIRTGKDEMVAPFDESGTPLVFLPVEVETQFPTVKKTIAADKAALKFFTNFGLCEPDLVDEIQKFILPKYTSEDVEIAIEEHLEDFKKICKALGFASGQKRERLVKDLQNSSFLLAINCSDHMKAFKKPGEIYIDNENTRAFFEGNSDIWFYDMIYADHKKLLEELGASQSVRMNHHNEKMWYKILFDSPGFHQRGVGGFDPNWEVDGLLYAVKHPNVKRARFIWQELLRPNAHLISGVIEQSGRKDYSQPYKTDSISTVGNIVRGRKWLPDKMGHFHIPVELSLDDLPDDFSKDEELAKKLGMKEVRVQEFARTRGINENRLMLFLELEEKDPDLFEEWANKALQKYALSDRTEKFNYLASIESVFEKPNSVMPETTEDAYDSEPNIIHNLERRRQKTQEEILISQLKQTESDQRFRRIPSILWEAKDNRVRAFLLEEYHGRCQICDATFSKRNGAPYFEGLYLVPRINAQWVDRPGNVLCLCPTCCAKFLHGQVITENVIEQILQCKLKKEGGNGYPGILVELCGDMVELRFTERHMLDLQEMIKASDAGPQELSITQDKNQDLGFNPESIIWED